MSGVRHLSEDLIKNTVRDTPLDSITILKLNYSELSGKKIRVIENLDKLKRLHTLNLAHNSIERLERLESLQKLKDLDVSHNHITKIEGLEKLSNLITLNLEGNQIETIPLWIAKKLKSLRNLRLASNSIESLQEVRKLRGLANLTFFSIAHNPLCDLPHYRLYIIFHLQSLDVLDGRRITSEERMEANRRFDQDEVQALHAEVYEIRSKYETLQEEHDKSLRDLENSQQNDSQRVRASRENERKIKDLRAELMAKEEMIGRKQAELSRANQKHYELEQELAFYKIDTKFTSLHKKPDTPSVAEDGDSLMESPYIGKSQHAKDRPDWPVNLRPSEKKRQPKSRVDDVSPDSILESELEDKHQKVEEANRRLAELTNQLHHTEMRVANAAEHLVKLTDLVEHSRTSLPDPDRENLERDLDALQQTIDELESNREQLLDNLDRNAADISEAEQNLDDLDRSLEASDLEDSEKEALLLERDDKEAFLTKAKDMREDLEQALADLEQMLEQKKSEMQSLDNQLSQTNPLGSEDHPDIGNVAQEVKSILASLKQGQATENEGLALRRRLAELERIADEKERALDILEKSLQEEKSANAAIRERIGRSPSPTSPSKAELEEDVRQLLAAKDRLQQELDEQKSVSADPSIKRELSKLKKENDRLKKENQVGKSLADAEVLSKIDSAIQKAQSGQPSSANMADPIERKLAALQKAAEKDTKQAGKDAKHLRDENARLQHKIANLSATLGEARARGSESTDSESSALVEVLRQELNDIRANMAGEDNLKRQLMDAHDRLRKVQAELERSRQMSRATDQPRSLSKYNKYSAPPQFDLDAGLDESYEESEATHDTVKRAHPLHPSHHPHSQSKRGANRFDERDGGTPGQGSSSQNSGRVTDENPRPSEPSRQSMTRVPPHPDDVMSIQSDAPQPYTQPRHPGNEPAFGGRGSKPSDRRRGDLGTVPETYESDLENPRLAAPQPNPETRRLYKELAKADSEIDKLQQMLADRDRDLNDTLRRTDDAEEVINRQKDEADWLKNELDKYKQEVERLAALLAGQGQFGEEERARINSLLGGVQQAGPLSTISASHPHQSLQNTGYDQISNSFVQGPSFRPGQLGDTPTGQGHILTSTPHKAAAQHVGFGHLAATHTAPQIPAQTNPAMQSNYTLPTYQPNPPNQVAPVYQVNPASSTGISVSQPSAYPVQSRVATQNAGHFIGPQMSYHQTGVQVPPTIALVPADTVPVVTMASNSTPTKTLVLNGSTSTTPVRGILKVNESSGLVCTVPEHHHLEDLYSKLREKYKDMKASFKESKSDRKEERKLSNHSRAAVELKHALKERRSELESLDLAINLQREQLDTLKSNWRLKKGQRRHAGDSDTENEGRRAEIDHYMNTELRCLEETLAKRRAELREADSRLVECRNSLDLVKDEAEQMIGQYDLVKEQLDSVQTELEVLDGNKTEREEQVAQLMVNGKKLTEERDTLQEQIDRIEEVTQERDAYFNTLTQQIQQSETVLTELQQAIRKQTADAEQNLHEIKLEAERHLASVRHSELELSEHYGDIKDIKSVEKRTEMSSMSSLEREVKERLENRKELLEKVKDKIEDEKEALQTLTIATEQKEDQLSVLKKSLTAARAESAELLREISERRCLLESLTAESNMVEGELNELRAKHSEGRQLLDKLEFETNSASSVLEKLRLEKDSVSRAVGQKSAELDQINRKVEMNKAAVTEMSNTQSSIESQIREKTSECEQLQNKLKQLQSQVGDAKFEKTSCESELQSVSQSLKDQRTAASKLKKILKDMEAKKATLYSQCEATEKQKLDLEQQLDQLRYDYQQINTLLGEVKGEVSEQQLAAAELRQDVSRLNEERSDRQQSLKDLATQYDRESLQLSDLTERAERELSHLREQQQVCQTRVGELTRELSRLMSEINKNRKEHGDLTQLRAKLEQTDQLAKIPLLDLCTCDLYNVTISVVHVMPGI
ncbi:CNTRL [Bugula neritina]|uniref:CNTRL n=1 Tax=Bugula neritina TaxID=10212 RepID=A0A7J7JI66_BUGNE|nr:CNTRL [Bugula neritina]